MPADEQACQQKRLPSSIHIAAGIIDIKLRAAIDSARSGRARPEADCDGRDNARICPEAPLLEYSCRGYPSTNQDQTHRSDMFPFRHLNNSFVHGAAACCAYAISPFVQSAVSPIIAGLVCVYAGWYRQAYLASFLGGVIVAFAGWMAFAIVSSPEIGFGAFIMVPVGLVVVLPVALAGYLVGKILSALAHRASKGAEGGA